MKPAWIDRAACRGVDPNLMVPEKSDLGAIQTAKEICATCPVKQECRDYGLEVHRQSDLDGVFGGLSKIERLRILRKENLPRRRQTPMNNGMRFYAPGREFMPCGTVSAYVRHLRYKEIPCRACKQAHAENAAMYRARRGRPSRAKQNVA